MCLEKRCLMPAEYFSSKFLKLLDFFTCAFSGKHTVKGGFIHILWYTVNILKGNNREIIA